MRRSKIKDDKLPNVKIEKDLKEEFYKFLEEDEKDYSVFVRENILQYINSKKSNKSA